MKWTGYHPIVFYRCSILPEWTRKWWRPPGIRGRLTPWRRMNARWPGPGRRPQACTECGSIHPVDAIRLAKSHGWDINTGGMYGSEAEMIPPTSMNSRGFSDVTCFGSGFIPRPIIMAHHFTQDELKSLNDAIFDANPYRLEMI